MVIINFEYAKAAGLSRYFTGKPCRKGHLVERHTSNRHCITCHAEEAARRYLADPLKVEKEASRYLKCREKKLAREKARYARNPTPIKAYTAAWAIANPEKKSAHWRAWAERNPEKLRLHLSSRRAKTKGADGSVSPDMVAQLMSKQGGKCACPCSALLSISGYHIDHIVALARGGEHIDSNLQLLTPCCNKRKHAQPDATFKARIRAELAA